MYHTVLISGHVTTNAVSVSSRWTCEDVAALVAREKRVSVRLIKHQSRCRANAARARQLAMYLSHVMLGRSLTEVGLAFHRDRTTVSYACGLIEDMRDDPTFDREVCALEAKIELALETRDV